MNKLSSLAKYYRDLLFSLSSQAGKHFIDINAVLRYGLTTDLSLFIPEIEELITNGIIRFKIEKASSDDVDKIVETANEIEDQEEQKEKQRGLFEDSDTSAIDSNLEEYEKKKASAILVAIYRKQQFDPYNREVIIGFPLVTGKVGNKKFCAPLFYYKARIEYEPLKNLISLFRDFEIPALNFQLVKHFVESDEDVEMIRQRILPYLHREDFELSTIKEIIKILSELVEGFKGITYSSQPASLKTALESRESDGAKAINTSIIVNAKRTGAYLVDDLAQIAQKEKTDGETVIDTILSMPVGDENSVEVENHSTNTKLPPLLFPLLSNISQRLAAVKAEKARLLVIQGPPGTGKSQTIVNLICHLVANGKTVLVSSHQNKALEVITKAMPKIDYLAMSLLKGEKESINELTNKIESFHSHVSGSDVNHLNELLENRKAELKKLDDNIKKLQIRFSELKILEREKYSKYQQYHKIRDYDLIDLSDSIHEGKEFAIASALSKYRELLQKIKEHYYEIEKIFSYDQTIDVTIENIGQLISTYEWVKENLFSERHGILSFCQQFSQSTFSFDECINYLCNLTRWVDKYCWNLISALKTLSEVYNLNLDFQTVKKTSVKYESVIDDIVKCAEELISKLQTLKEYGIEDGYPEYPDNPTLEEAVFNLDILNNSKNSWWKWHFSIKARSARKFFISKKLPKPEYKIRDAVLKKLKAWNNHWTLRNQIAANLKYLDEMGIPIKKASLKSSIGELHHNANIGQKYVNVILALNKLSLTQYDTINKATEDRLTQISTSEEISAFKECLEQTKTYLEARDKLGKLKANNHHFASLCDSIFSSLEEAIFRLTQNKKEDETIGRLKKLYPYFKDYEKLKSHEQNQLKTLINTCTKIREKILQGSDISALKKPDLVIEAFRLLSFIKNDLVENPDNINEIAARIKILKMDSRRLIEKILDTSRRLALKKAESNRETLFLINKLKQILKRKRKTYSFVQLRDQIDYMKLLSVFPCWIMSIEDVARIFPLQAGLFDYLIVDEASQCNQATALHLAYRAKRMIVVGDSKQMKNPNTQFLSDSVVQLNLTKHKLDNHPKEAFLHGRNSLLDLAIGCQDISPVFLNEHFRCEPPIIEFSNKHFYNNQLKILTPFRRKKFNPCMEIRLINGAYDDPENTKQNVVEANAVIAELKRMLDNGELVGDKKDEKLTVGILSPFRHQASLLQGMMYETLEEYPHLLKEHEMIASTVDGFQGDERDLILYSFRYAPNSKPGTIHALQKDDDHSLGRLNVAFSRARRKVVCFISLPKDNFPKGLIRDYLNHVLSVQNFSYNRLGNPNEKEKCQSDFERDVFDDLVNSGLEVYAQVACAGFFIDFVVIDKEGRRMAVECDGEFHYEDGELREEDYQRQDIIERYGWFVHRISSRRYYANPKEAIDSLLVELASQKIDEEIISSALQKEIDSEEYIKDSFEECHETYPKITLTIEDKIIELLSEQGSMPLWKIAQELGKPKDEIISILEKLLEQEWVINYIENGVKLWKAID